MPNEVDALKPFQPSELSWHRRITYAADLFKALVKQHHKELIPVLRPFVPPDEAGRLRDLTEPQDGNIFWIPR